LLSPGHNVFRLQQTVQPEASGPSQKFTPCTTALIVSYNEGDQMQSVSVYRLQTSTMGVTTDNGKRVTITLPAEALLEVVSEVAPDGTVEVLWNSRRISMFVIDLRQRAQSI